MLILVCNRLGYSNFNELKELQRNKKMANLNKENAFQTINQRSGAFLRLLT
jgi:hypothetical protein